MENLKLAVVHAEPCLAFAGDSDTPDDVCEACGWLVDEHGLPFAVSARLAHAAA